MVTRPNWMAPFHMERGTVCPRVRWHSLLGRERTATLPPAGNASGRRLARHPPGPASDGQLALCRHDPAQDCLAELVERSRDPDGRVADARQLRLQASNALERGPDLIQRAADGRHVDLGLRFAER